MKKYLIIALILLFITPLITHAALFNNLTDLMDILLDLIEQAVTVVVALALLFFFWGLANFILYASDETKRKEGRSIMLWGIIALFVMLSVWGLVRVLQNTFLKGGAGTGSGVNVNAPAGSKSGYFLDDSNNPGILYYGGVDQDGVFRTGPVRDAVRDGN